MFKASTCLLLVMFTIVARLAWAEDAITPVSYVEASSFVVDAAWSPDGGKFASLSNFGRTIDVWTKNGGKLVSFDRPEALGPSVGRCLLFLHDNQTLVAPAPTTQALPPGEYYRPAVGLWNSQTGEFLRSVVVDGLSEPAGICALSPSGRFLAVVSRRPSGVVKLIDTTTWRTTSSFHLRRG